MKKFITNSALLFTFLVTLTNCSNESKPKDVCECIKLLQATNVEGKALDKNNILICNKLINEKSDILSINENIEQIKIFDYEKYDKLVFDCTGRNIPGEIVGSYSNGIVTWHFLEDGQAEIDVNGKTYLHLWSGTPEDITITEMMDLPFPPLHASVAYKGLLIKSDKYFKHTGFFKRQ